MFRGSHENAVDEKGRVPFPARFRELLASTGQNTLVLTMVFDPCIRAYPLKEWESVEGWLRGMPQFDPDAQRLRRLLSGECAECEVDKQGRILIPQRLRKLANIDKDVVFVGLSNMVEIWSAPAWAQHQDELHKDPRLLERVASGVQM